MFVAVLVLLAALALLSYSADHFVLGAARLSAHLRISMVTVGAVVIGFGTSAPELLVSSIAAGQGHLDLSVGNVVGSNVANITLVLGAAALVLPLTVKSTILRREAPISVGAVILFAVLIQGGLTRIEGLAMLAVGASMLTAIIVGGRDTSELGAETAAFVGQSLSLRSESVRTLAGLVGTVASAQALVWAATTIADEVGLSGGFVGFTMVAIGTSLPELVTSMAAVRHGETDLVVGNLLGSNLFNSMGVGGAIALVGPGPIPDEVLTGWGALFMVAAAVVAGTFMATRRLVVRWEGAVLLAAYIGSLVLLSASDSAFG